jgi:ubiquinone biosynthesis protein UbiJ
MNTTTVTPPPSSIPSSSFTSPLLFLFRQFAQHALRRLQPVLAPHAPELQRYAHQFIALHIVKATRSADSQSHTQAAESTHPVFSAHPAFITLHVQISETGTLHISHAEPSSPIAPTTALTITLNLAQLNAARQQHSLMTAIRLEGEATLAQTMQHIIAPINLTTLSWLIEHDLAHYVGDVMAHHIGQQVRQVPKHLLAQAQDSVAQITDYLLYERPTMLARPPFADWFNDVHTLNQQLTALEQRTTTLHDTSHSALAS